MQEKFKNTLELATYAHNGAYRKSGEPYIQHPIRVARILEELCLPKFVIDAAYLHDTLEDSDITDEDILSVSSPETLNIVKMLTKIRYQDKLKLIPGEKGYNIDEYDENIMKDFFATVVKISDRIDNASTVIDGSEEFKRKYIIETIDKYVKVATRLDDISNFHFSDYDFSNEEYEKFSYVGERLHMIFNMALKSEQSVLDERYCPIMHMWVPEKEMIFLGRNDGIMISHEGISKYMTEPECLKDNFVVNELKEEIDEYIDYIKSMYDYDEDERCM